MTLCVGTLVSPLRGAAALNPRSEPCASEPCRRCWKGQALNVKAGNFRGVTFASVHTGCTHEQLPLMGEGDNAQLPPPRKRWVDRAGQHLAPRHVLEGCGWGASLGHPCGHPARRQVEVLPQDTGCLGLWAPGQDLGGVAVPTGSGCCHRGVTLPLTIPTGELGRPARPRAAAAPRHPLRPPAEPRSERFRQTLLPSPIPSQLQEPVPGSMPGTARPQIATALGAAAHPTPRLGSPGWGARGPQANPDGGTAVPWVPTAPHTGL